MVVCPTCRTAMGFRNLGFRLREEVKISQSLNNPFKMDQTFLTLSLSPFCLLVFYTRLVHRAARLSTRHCSPLDQAREVSHQKPPTGPPLSLPLDRAGESTSLSLSPCHRLVVIDLLASSRHLLPRHKAVAYPQGRGSCLAIRQETAGERSI